ncbi:MAG: flagellar basal body rod protein FlgB [Candidatus Symbiobacter sp.]|nr:flagellar basal body rod protein FlgB [Candidatus Symbiobacter sp.]
MDITTNSLMGLIAKRMDYLSQRQKVLAQNISNSDTPGYRAQDMKELNFAKALAAQTHVVAPAVTNPAHIAVTSGKSEFGLNRGKGGYETAPDGNSVVLEEQSNKMAQNQIDYATATNLYSKYVTMMKLALRG